MNTAQAFAPGKLIVVGEHAVVYGHPALAIAVDRGTTVHLERRHGPTALESAAPDDPRLMQGLSAILPSTGIGVHLRSDLPIGRGMGSSAALAVALSRAYCALEQCPATPERIDAMAMTVERVFHGNPSGIDHTVSATGGAVTFRRTDEGPCFASVQFPDLPLVVIDSGEMGDTAIMVEGVRSRKPGIDKTLAQIGTLSERFMEAMPDEDTGKLGEMLTENHRLLQDIGVSTPTLDAIVTQALEAGAAGAKLAGAGGGGVVIAITTDPDGLIHQATRAGFRAFTVRVFPQN